MRIAIEGCIGAGKTTVADKIANRLGCGIIKEDFNSNPFLSQFYKYPEKYSFETEITFLLIHYHQIKEIVSNPTENNIVADFYIKKDLLFAEMNLAKDELKAFVDLYTFIYSKIPEPNLLICLHASDELIFQRIQQRNREIENSVNKEYFSKLNHLYEDFFEHISIPKIHVNMDEHDFLRDGSSLERLLNQINGYIG